MRKLALFFCLISFASVYGQESKTFEIWNWEDLSQILSKQNTEGYTNFILMQDLGIPGQSSTYGNAYENPECSYYHTNKAYGWYGYQGFTGNESAFNSANATTACGWTATGWTAIGTSVAGTNFTSVFDGQHHTIISHKKNEEKIQSN